MDCQILKLVLTRDKPGLTKKQLVFRCFQVQKNSTGGIAACFLSNFLHCKNKECQISKQMPSTATGVTWHNTDCVAALPKPAQGCEGRAGAESSLGAAPGPGRRTLVRWSNRRAAAAGVARRSQAWMACPRPAGSALKGATGLKKQKRA